MDKKTKEIQKKIGIATCGALTLFSIPALLQNSSTFFAFLPETLRVGGFYGGITAAYSLWYPSLLWGLLFYIGLCQPFLKTKVLYFSTGCLLVNFFTFFSP